MALFSLVRPIFYATTCFIILGGLILQAITDYRTFEPESIRLSYEKHLDVVLTVRNPLTVFSGDDWLAVFGVVDLMISYVFMGSFVGVIADRIVKRLDKEAQAKEEERKENAKKLLENFHKILIENKCPICDAPVKYIEKKKMWECETDSKHILLKKDLGYYRLKFVNHWRGFRHGFRNASKS